MSNKKRSGVSGWCMAMGFIFAICLMSPYTAMAADQYTDLTPMLPAKMKSKCPEKKAISVQIDVTNPRGVSGTVKASMCPDKKFREFMVAKQLMSKDDIAKFKAKGKSTNSAAKSTTWSQLSSGCSSMVSPTDMVVCFTKATWNCTWDSNCTF